MIVLLAQGCRTCGRREEGPVWRLGLQLRGLTLDRGLPAISVVHIQAVCLLLGLV